jgi:hypothetical protein
MRANCELASHRSQREHEVLLGSYHLYSKRDNASLNSVPNTSYSKQ